MTSSTLKVIVIFLLSMVTRKTCNGWRYKRLFQNIPDTLLPLLQKTDIRQQNLNMQPIAQSLPQYYSYPEQQKSVKYSEHSHPNLQKAKSNNYNNIRKFRNYIQTDDNYKKHRVVQNQQKSMFEYVNDENGLESRNNLNMKSIPIRDAADITYIDRIQPVEITDSDYDNDNDNYDGVVEYDDTNEHDVIDINGDDGVMDIEETLPLSAVIDGDLLSFSNDRNSKFTFMNFDMNDAYEDTEDYSHYDISVPDKSDILTDDDMIFKNDINSNDQAEGRKMALHFIKAFLATLEVVTNTLFGMQEPYMSLKSTNDQLGTPSVNPFIIRGTSPISFPEVHAVSKRRRRKKHRKYKNKKLYLHGKDDRSLVFLPLMRKFPFSNVVRLSSGCTGTLLTPYHVLTAAHCVHNGEDFKNNLQMLKIEIPDTMGFRVYYIEKISIPKDWRRSGYLSEAARASYDYAIVRLSVGVPGKTNFLPLSVPKSNVLNQNMHFLGFPTDSDSGLYKSKCHPMYSVSIMDGNLIVARCNSAVGNSGAAVFVDDPRDGKRIVGVLSNTMSIMSMPYGGPSRYSIITALTWNNLYEICAMMAPLGQKYNVCPSFQTLSRSHKAPLKNRVIPFFG